MGPELPIACSLDRAQLAERGEMFTDLARAALVGKSRGADAIELRFRAQQQVRDGLQRFIELESRCCPFLQFSLDERDGELVLCVAGPHDAEPILGLLYDAAAHATSSV